MNWHAWQFELVESYIESTFFENNFYLIKLPDLAKFLNRNPVKEFLPNQITF